MNTAKTLIHQIIEEIPEENLKTLLEYAYFIKQKSTDAEFNDLIFASESSLNFWDNDIDDEVWNNV